MQNFGEEARGMSDLTQWIEYEADGVRMAGLYVRPRVGPADGARRPGILVSPPGPGLGDHSKGVAQRLAEAGYAAFALDYHGGGALISDAAEMMARIRGFIENPLSIRARVAKALEVLAVQPEVDAARIAAIGYCFGGTAVL